MCICPCIAEYEEKLRYRHLNKISVNASNYGSALGMTERFHESVLNFVFGNSCPAYSGCLKSFCPSKKEEKKKHRFNIGWFICIRNVLITLRKTSPV